MSASTHTTPPRAPLFRPVHPLGAARPDTLAALRAGVLAEVRDDVGRDLSARQLAVLLVLRDGAADFGALAKEIGISKPALTRALDRLGSLLMVERRIERLDRRRCTVNIRSAGLNRLNAIRDAMDVEVAL